MELNGVEPTPDQLEALALTNYGHFTSMLVEGGKVRGWSLHMQRLARDCLLLFDVDLDTERVRHYVRRALLGDTQRTVVRVTVYDPALGLGNLGAEADPRILVTTRAAPAVDSPPLSLRAVSYRRESPAVKHVGLFGALRHRRAALRDGFDDVLFVNPDGTISETATSNIGFVREGRVVWPRSDWLAGITMGLINRALAEPVATTEPLMLAELAGVEAVFTTNAAVGIRPVASVDSVTWPTEHKLVRELRGLYTGIPAETV